MTRSLYGLVSLALVLLVMATTAKAEWRFREGPTDLIDPDHAMGLSSSFQSLHVFCLDGVETVMAWGYPAQPGDAETGPLTISVSDTEFVVAATLVAGEGYWWGSAPTGLIDTLRRGAQAVIAPPGAEPIAIDLSGSARAIDAAMGDCSEQNAAQAGELQSTATAPPNVAMNAEMEAACGGSYTVDERAVLSGLIDMDDTPDYVLDWAGVTCQSNDLGRGAGNCGINMCQISVYLTTQDSAMVLGLAPELVLDAFGRARLRTIALRPSCPDGALDCIVFWQIKPNGLEALHGGN